jgi:hypothetical protein
LSDFIQLVTTENLGTMRGLNKGDSKGFS